VNEGLRKDFAPDRTVYNCVNRVHLGAACVFVVLGAATVVDERTRGIIQAADGGCDPLCEREPRQHKPSWTDR